MQGFINGLTSSPQWRGNMNRKDGGLEENRRLRDMVFEDSTSQTLDYQMDVCINIMARVLCHSVT